jgi:hypothetical protein
LGVFLLLLVVRLGRLPAAAARNDERNTEEGTG